MSMNCFWVPFGIPEWHRGQNQGAQRCGRKGHSHSTVCSFFYLIKRVSMSLSCDRKQWVGRRANSLDCHGGWRDKGASQWADTALWGPEMNLLLAYIFWGTPSSALDDNLVKMTIRVINCLFFNIMSHNFAPKQSFSKNHPECKTSSLPHTEVWLEVMCHLTMYTLWRNLFKIHFLRFMNWVQRIKNTYKEPKWC